MNGNELLRRESCRTVIEQEILLNLELVLDRDEHTTGLCPRLPIKTRTGAPRGQMIDSQRSAENHQM